MSLLVEQVDLVPLEGIKMVETVEPVILEPVVFSIAVEVMADDENGDVTVGLPQELRPTERLASYLQTVLKARGLTIKHWRMEGDEEALRTELEKLSNVVVDTQTAETGD
jgi:hypothetical protein